MLKSRQNGLFVFDIIADPDGNDLEEEVFHVVWPVFVAPLTFENQVASYLEYASALCAYSELWSVEKIDQTAQLRVRDRILLQIVPICASGHAFFRFLCSSGSPKSN